jgi:Fe2+ transport system protein FeoA
LERKEITEKGEIKMMLSTTINPKQNLIMPLYKLDVGQTGEIITITATKEQTQHELSILGVMPKVEVTILANHQSHFILKVGGKTIGIDQEIASEIIVRPIG